LSENPTFEDIVRVVNGNSARIQQVQVTNATLTVSGMPALQSSFALERPRRFRLTGDTSFTGREIDLGSNEDLYWIWIKRNDRRAVYYGRHDEYYQSGGRTILPIPPTWLIEALGVIEMDPTGQHEGPLRSQPSRLELRTRVPTPTGELLKVTMVDDRYGWVLEQHVYDVTQNDQLLASAIAEDFNYYPSQGVTLPRRVEIHLPPAELSFTMRIDQHVINRLYSDPIQLWTMPPFSGYEAIDVATMSSPPPRYAEPPRATGANRRWRYDSDQYRTTLRRLPPRDRTFR
jgi:hypothetical protein